MTVSISRTKSDGCKVLTNAIRGNVNQRTPQHPLNPGCLRELGMTINELKQLGAKDKLENAITNTSIMGMLKPDKQGGWSRSY